MAKTHLLMCWEARRSLWLLVLLVKLDRRTPAGIYTSVEEKGVPFRRPSILMDFWS